MRVISGIYKGKKLEGYNIDGTRPTMDRVKESVFAMIQNKIKGSICLDLFAGSGSLGIEALSNGAKSCTFIEHNPEMVKILKKNLSKIDNFKLIEIDYKKFLKETNERYDIIFLDPPYNSPLLNKAIKYIEDYNLLNKDGIIICEYENKEPVSNLKLVKEKKYGPKKIKIYQG